MKTVCIKKNAHHINQINIIISYIKTARKSYKIYVVIK